MTQKPDDQNAGYMDSIKAHLQAASDKSLAKAEAKAEKRFNDFSQYVGRQLAHVEAKIEALAEVVIRNEEDIAKLDQQEAFEEKLDPFMKIAGSSFDKKIGDKVSDFMKTSVEDAFEAAVNAFAGHVAARIDKIESKLGILEDSNDTSFADKT